MREELQLQNVYGIVIWIMARNTSPSEGIKFYGPLGGNLIVGRGRES